MKIGWWILLVAMIIASFEFGIIFGITYCVIIFYYLYQEILEDKPKMIILNFFGLIITSFGAKKILMGLLQSKTITETIGGLIAVIILYFVARKMKD